MNEGFFLVQYPFYLFLRYFFGWLIYLQWRSVVDFKSLAIAKSAEVTKISPKALITSRTNTAPANANCDNVTVIASSNKYFDIIKWSFCCFLFLFVRSCYAFIYILNRWMLEWFTAGYTTVITNRSTWSQITR